ncbi:WD repeat-containing protein 25-like [Oculina patagonica]
MCMFSIARISYQFVVSAAVQCSSHCPYLNATRFQRSMESLCAYDSSSSSDDESPKNKKQKVTEVDGNSVRQAGNSRQPGDKILKPSQKLLNSSGILGRKVSESKQITTCSTSASNHSDRFESQVVKQTNDKNTSSFVGSLARRTNTNVSISGPSVKPYVSKRERERLTQTNAATSAAPLLTNHQLEKIDCDGSLKGVTLNSEQKTEISSRKTADLVCRPPKQLQLNLEGHSQGVNCVRWNPAESNLLLSASMDHVVSVWDTHKGGACTRRLTRHAEAVKDSRWSLCGSQVLSCGYDKTARLFNLETGQEMKAFPHKNYVTCVQFHPTEPALFLAGTFKSAILCWDTRTGNVATTYSAFFGQVQDIAFLPGGEEFISAAEVVRRNSTDKGIMVWDFRSTALLSNQIYQEAFTCTCLKVHPTESHFVAQSNGDYIALFSTRKPYKLNKFKRYEGHKVSGYHIGCDFSPDGRIVSSGSADGKIFFYDHFTSRVIRTLDAHSAPCMDVAYHPTLPSCVASCGWDGKVKVWT